MTEEPVRSHRNPRLIETARLHRARERRKVDKTLIEGPHLLTEALEAGVVPETLFALTDDLDTAAKAAQHEIELILVKPAGLARLAGTKTPRGPIGIVPIPEHRELAARGLIVSWGVGDPGNVGTLIRTAAAFGWGFGYTEGTADPWSPKVLRGGVGAQFRIGTSPVRSMGELAGYTTVASIPSGGSDPAALGRGRYAVLVGDEAAGLPGEVIERADVSVTVPMPGGTESLNAAVAAGIVVHALSR